MKLLLTFVVLVTTVLAVVKVGLHFRSVIINQNQTQAIKQAQVDKARSDAEAARQRALSEQIRTL